MQNLFFDPTLFWDAESVDIEQHAFDYPSLPGFWILGMRTT